MLLSRDEYYAVSCAYQVPREKDRVDHQDRHYCAL